VQRLNDARIAIGPIKAAASVEPNTVVGAPNDHAIPVVLDLVHPRRATLALLRGGRKARLDKAWGKQV
jgi:hypothetical protein